MNAVKLIAVLMFVLLLTVRPAGAQDADGNMAETKEYEENTFDSSEEAPKLDSEVKPYEWEFKMDDQKDSETEETLPSINDDQPAQPLMNTEALPADQTQETNTPVETPSEEPKPESKEEVKNMPDPSLVEAIKTEISERRKVSGKLDIFDGQANKVRTLDLIEFKPNPTKDGEMDVVQADFRDTASGDVVTLDIKVAKDKDAYAVKDMTIASVAAPAAKEVKKDYTEEDIKNFMHEYIETQSQATGTFDLYDEKAKKMRSLEFVKLDEKMRKYGIITIATAEFKDKASGETVTVDVNTENKEGLSVTAMRLKSVAKPVPAAPAQE